MKKKNRISTNSFREIKKSFPRFISLIVISLLGVFVFSGLRSTAPDMMHTLDSYLDSQNTYDIKIISTLGLTDNDINALKNINGILDVEPSYTKDLLIKINSEEETIFNISSLPTKINTLKLIEGHLPLFNNEIVVEPNFLSKNNKKIGDKLLLDDSFNTKEVTIVGTITSTLYYTNTRINQNRGSTSIGSGTINYYAYVLPSNFKDEYYSNLYLTLNDTLPLETNSKEYNELIDNITNKINDIKEEQELYRYNEIYNKAKEEIDKEETKVNNELNKALKEINSNQTKLNNAKKTLDKAKKDLNTFKKELDKASKQITEAKNSYNKTLQTYNLKESTLQDSLTTLNNSITELENLLNIYPDNEELLTKLNELKTNKSQIELLIKTKQTLTANEKTYQTNLTKYNNSLTTYNKNLKTYNSNVSELNKAKKEYNSNKTKALNEIAEAREKLKEIKKTTWYINDRKSYQTYTDYINDTESITNLALLFPIVFFAVAVLVSLISMNRMVEDDRSEIGTLKSLGFSNLEIMHKYSLFAFLATIIGSILGSIGGSIFIPTIIFNIYGMLFDLPSLIIGLNLKINILSFLITSICICGATIITTHLILKEKPSELMRPKPPKNGKRVFLENIKFIWNHLKFSKKVIIRNIFRYKKRVLVTIFGIAGCTALVLCGFCIKDAIVDINEMQYGQTFKFDNMIYVTDYNEDKINSILDNKDITLKTPVMLLNANVNNTSVNMFITESNKDLSNVVNLVDHQTKEIITLPEDEVIISDKLSELENIKVGDTIEVIDIDNNSYELKVSGIVNNYIGHYIYLSKSLYNKFNNNYSPNIIYTNTIELTPKEKDKLKEELLQNEEIRNITYKQDLMESVDNMLKSLDKVVVILIILAALLSFVVLYNLSNININERQREIATLKVLGFYNKEVDNYITSENIILTIIGLSLGLFGGYFLTESVIKTVEMDMARFIYDISINSYFYAAIISIIFTIIVNIVTHFTLKRIDMIESLKSVE